MLPNPLEYLDSYRSKNWYIDIPFLIAKKSTHLWLGKGFLFQSEKKEILKYFNQKIINDKWFEKFYKFGMQESLLGKAYILIYKTKNGNYSIQIPSPSFNSRVAKYNEEEQAAELWFMSEQADSATLTWVTIDAKKVTYNIYKAENKKEKEIIIGSVHTKIQPSIDPTTSYTYDNPLGFLPIAEVTNLPVVQLYGNSSTLNVIPDCWPAYDLIDDVQHTIRQKRIERTFNVTTIFGNFDNQTVNKMVADSNGNMLDNPKKDMLVNVGSAGYNTTGQGGLTVLQGDPKFKEYITDYDATMKQIFNASGYDYDQYAKLNYENKTTSLMNNKFDMETTETKIAHYSVYFYRIFDLLLYLDGKWDGKEDRPYSFKMIPIAMTDQVLQNEIINSRITNGTMSVVEAISEYENINIQQAQDKLDKIIEESKTLDKELNPIDVDAEVTSNNPKKREKEVKGNIKDVAS